MEQTSNDQSPLFLFKHKHINLDMTKYVCMPFTKAIMLVSPRRWNGLKCSGCNHEFKAGESVYVHCRGGRNPKVVGHLCEKCYDIRYIDV